MSTRPIGAVTRGTTHPNRLRRMDRWMAWALAPQLRAARPPLVVDLGFGASAVTVVELHARLARVRPDVQVVGVEIDADRVRAARPWADPPAVRFLHGGFEVPLPEGRPTLIRAANVLRQYSETEVADAWTRLVSRLAPGGTVVEGTCDEIGRLSTWVRLQAPRGDGPLTPESLSLSWRLAGLERPSVIAERLPKALIHHNVPGEPVHGLLEALDRAWDHSAPHASYGVRQRWLAAVARMVDQGWPVLDGPRRWRLGELSVPWSVVAPLRQE